MFYQIEDVLHPIDPAVCESNHLIVGILTPVELKQQNEHFHFHQQTIEEAMHPHNNHIDLYENYDFGTICFHNTRGSGEVKDFQAAFYIRRNQLLISCEDTGRVLVSLREVISRIPMKSLTLEKLIYALFEKLISKDFSILQEINEQIEEIEEDIMNDRNVSFHQKIAPLRKTLLLFENHYSHLIEMGSDLQENENEVFTEENLRYFHMMTDRVARLFNQTRMLREYITQVREAYQAQTDNHLNQIMKLFTVVTTIFLPLTLIVGWYGMNFTNMPELTWKYGYLAVIVLSVAVVSFCFYYFKKKNLF